MRSDSAGVEIVETAAALWGDGEGWRVRPEPVLSIGEVAGNPAYLFGDIEGAVRLGERIAVADEQTLDVRYYDLAGQHLLTSGGPGSGPGELRLLLQFERCEGDRVHAFDVMDLTMHVRGPDGELLRELRVPEPGSERARQPFAMACATESSGFVAAGTGGAGTSDRLPGEILRHRSPVWVLDEAWQVTAELGEYLSTERVWSFNVETGQANGSGPHPFGRSISLALGSDHAFVGSGESLAVDVYGRDGQLVRRLRGPADDLSISPDLVAEYRAATLDEAQDRRRVNLAYQDYPMPDGFPAYTEMRLDPDGALWVKRWVPPWGGPNTWGIFASDGAFLGHVELPVGARVTDLGSDWILVIETDELGIQRVRMYGLVK